jgi:hypothetical protein
MNYLIRINKKNVASINFFFGVYLQIFQNKLHASLKLAKAHPSD